MQIWLRSKTPCMLCVAPRERSPLEIHDPDQRTSRSASSLFPDVAAQELGAAGGGEAERECRLRPRLAFHPDSAAVQLGNRLDDGEAETRAGRGFLARAAGSIEAVEDARQVFGRDPGAGI